jgi:DNA-binding response OmpR family regulator
MFSTATQQQLPPRHTRTVTVCVVDPQASDYRSWQQSAADAGVRLRTLANAEEDLRVARTERFDLWVVNAELPGRSGYELCLMLKTQSAATPVFMVADRYSPQAEQEAWRSRATLFGCKPTHEEWLAAWLAAQANQHEFQV